MPESTDNGYGLSLRDQAALAQRKQAQDHEHLLQKQVLQHRFRLVKLGCSFVVFAIVLHFISSLPVAMQEKFLEQIVPAALAGLGGYGIGKGGRSSGDARE